MVARRSQGPSGESDTAMPIFESGLKPLPILPGGARVEQPVAPLGHEDVGSEDTGPFPGSGLALREGHSLLRPCVAIRRGRVPDGRIIARGNRALRIPDVVEVTDLDDVARVTAHHAFFRPDALCLRMGHRD